MNTEKLEKLLDQITQWVNENQNDTSKAGNILVIAELVIDEFLGQEAPQDDIEEAAEIVARQERQAIIMRERSL